jgi:hypothetical protein
VPEKEGPQNIPSCVKVLLLVEEIGKHCSRVLEGLVGTLIHGVCRSVIRLGLSIRSATLINPWRARM